MKNHRLRLAFVAMLAGLSLAVLQCSNRSPFSPETQDPVGTDGLLKLKLDIRLSKPVIQAIDSVTVEARRAQASPVRARLAITGNRATGSLEVPTGEGWVVTAEIYIGPVVGYRGQSQSITVAAGRTVPVNIVIQSLMDLVAEEVFITRLDSTEPIDPNSLIEGDEVHLKVSVRNTGSIDLTGWRADSYVDGEAYKYGESFSVEANSTLVVFSSWTAVAGTHTVSWTVDTNDEVKESDETNNTVSLTVNVQRSRITSR